MTALVLMRHGQTTWARANRFAGWADAPLSKTGEEEARRAGRCLAKANLRFDICHTSYLSRAQSTLSISLETMGHPPVPIETSWRLNERHYGALQGRNRLDAVREFGNTQLLRWRRSFRDRPPPLSEDSRWLPQNDRLYSNVNPDDLPKTESLRDAALRVVPHWETRIAPQLRSGKHMLIVAHTSSIRGLIRLLEGLDDDACEAFSTPTAVPILYSLAADLSVLEKTDVSGDLASQLRTFVMRHKPRAAVSWI